MCFKTVIFKHYAIPYNTLSTNSLNLSPAHLAADARQAEAAPVHALRARDRCARRRRKHQQKTCQMNYRKTKVLI